MNCPPLVTALHTPKIIWYQTDTTVVIRIILNDVEKYYLRVECDQLLFSTVVNNKNYYLCLHLFGGVVAENTTHTNIAREIKIYLAKAHKWTEWLRLHHEKQKNPLIIPDADHLYEVDWTKDLLIMGERESFTEYKRRHNITQIMPDVPSTDEEESDDECMDSIFW